MTFVSGITNVHVCAVVVVVVVVVGAAAALLALRLTRSVFGSSFDSMKQVEVLLATWKVYYLSFFFMSS